MTITDVGEIGVMINYLVAASGIATGLMFSYAGLAAQASSIQRLMEYAEWDDHEKSFEDPLPVKGAEWPSTGAIEAKSISVRYRDGLPLVLDNVSFSIKSGQ